MSMLKDPALKRRQGLEDRKDRDKDRRLEKEGPPSGGAMARRGSSSDRR
jgi:hypothetical protein